MSGSRRCPMTDREQVLDLGTRVRWAERYGRSYQPVGESESFVVFTREARPPVKGFIVGVRHRPIGRIVAESETDHWSGRSYKWNEFRQRGVVSGYLVAWDLRRKPEFVPLDAVTAVEAPND